MNSAIRFLLELGALAAFGIWGYQQSDSGVGILLAIMLPAGFAALWGIFAVRDDPSRSGKTVVQTPGLLRLILELALFAAATWMLFDLGYSLAGWIFGAILLAHYSVSYKRVRWLLRKK